MSLRQFFYFLTLWLVLPVGSQTNGPAIRTPSQTRRTQRQTVPKYPWHLGVTATIFWVGEKPTRKNPTPNHQSSWDTKWQQSFGGFDNPDSKARQGYLPKAFVPKQNPFYIALPYNDLIDHRRHKPEAAKVIPWFKRYAPEPGQSVCKGRWVEMARNGKVCYAQWEDCGPFSTTNWEYVFRYDKVKNSKNKDAGIDISPAVRDYFGLKSGQKIHWRFVEFTDVKRGPWSLYGTNNPFVNPKARR